MNSVDLTVLPQNLLLWQREKIYLLIQKDASVEEYEKLASTFLGEKNLKISFFNIGKNWVTKNAPLTTLPINVNTGSKNAIVIIIRK